MSKLLKDQILDASELNSQKSNDDIMLTKGNVEDKESEIEYGNLKDYMDIFGESDDI